MKFRVCNKIIDNMNVIVNFCCKTFVVCCNKKKSRNCCIEFLKKFCND